ncbi:hypothetical protein [Mameliella sp. MMSF_3552]|uniref:hypothetical protein n=1 Tax=unclassified Mameliella TaxID=2630630 RepID=UPI003531DEAF
MRDWMAARADELLPVECFHLVFTLPAEVAQVACLIERQPYYGFEEATLARRSPPVAAFTE